MSAWPEAVWIVKELQNGLDLNKQIQDYVNKLNGINLDVNTLRNNLSVYNTQFEQLKENLMARATTIRATKRGNENIPNITTEESFQKGAIWFVVS